MATKTIQAPDSFSPPVRNIRDLVQLKYSDGRDLYIDPCVVSGVSDSSIPGQCSLRHYDGNTTLHIAGTAAEVYAKLSEKENQLAEKVDSMLKRFRRD